MEKNEIIDFWWQTNNRLAKSGLIQPGKHFLVEGKRLYIDFKAMHAAYVDYLIDSNTYQEYLLSENVLKDILMEDSMFLWGSRKKIDSKKNVGTLVFKYKDQLPHLDQKQIPDIHTEEKRNIEDLWWSTFNELFHAGIIKSGEDFLLDDKLYVSMNRCYSKYIAYIREKGYNRGFMPKETIIEALNNKYYYGNKKKRLSKTSNIWVHVYHWNNQITPKEF
jgi:hypothetical protein